MKFKMLGLALSLTAAFGLVACSDDSSSSGSKGGVDECKVTREGDKVFVKLVDDGVTMNTTRSIDADGVITEIAKFSGKVSKADFDASCKEQQDDKTNLSVECDESTNTITGTYKDEDIENADDLEADDRFMCEMMLDPEGFLQDIENAADEAGEDED